MDTLFDWLDAIWKRGDIVRRRNRASFLAFERLEPRQLLAADGLLFFAVPDATADYGGEDLAAELRGECIPAHSWETQPSTTDPTAESPELLYLADLARAIGDAVDLDEGPDSWRAYA